MKTSKEKMGKLAIVSTANGLAIWWIISVLLTADLTTFKEYAPIAALILVIAGVAAFLGEFIFDFSQYDSLGEAVRQIAIFIPIMFLIFTISTILPLFFPILFEIIVICLSFLYLMDVEKEFIKEWRN